MRRSYAEVAGQNSSPATPQQPPTTNSVRNQLNEVAAKLSAAATPAVPVQAPCAPPAAAASTPPSRESRKAIEDALRLLPKIPETEGARSSLQAQLDQFRGAVPPGARLDAAKAALERAQTRKELASQALSLAQKTMDEATQECVHLQSSIDEMRKEMAAGLVAPALPTPAPAPHAVQALQQATALMLDQLASTPGINPAHVQVAQQLSAQLVQGCQTTLAQAQAVSPAAPAPDRERRHSEKSPPQVPPGGNAGAAGDAQMPAVPARLVGKQMPKKTLQDMWPGVSTKVLKSSLGKRGEKSVLL